MSDEYDPTEEEQQALDQEAHDAQGGDANEDGIPKEGEPLGEGWYGVTRPGQKAAPPPVADRSGRRKLYTTVATRAVDTSVFSEVIKSDRVWWTPEDEPEFDQDYPPFDVDISDNGIAARYDVGETTRRADFFVIKSATDNAKKTAVSIKAIDISTAQMLGQSVDALAREIELFQACKDAYVCAAFEVIRGDSSLCMALESIAGAPLNVQLARGAENYTEADARRLVGQCVHAVAAVHKAGIAHRDIVPDNFVFTSKTDIASVKLCDFSFATRLASPTATTAVAPGGDPEFQAPEIAREAAHGLPADAWSLGCLAHLLISGDTPLHDSNTTRLRMKISKGEVTVGAAHASWPKNVSKGADSFVHALIVADAAKRPALAAVLALPWLAATDDVPLATFKAQLKQWNDTR